MRFKLDENLPWEAARPLESAGHDVTTVLSQQMGGWPDEQIASAIFEEQRVMITLDLDFADIRAYPPDSLPGIIVVRTKSQDRESIISALESLDPIT